MHEDAWLSRELPTTLSKQPLHCHVIAYRNAHLRGACQALPPYSQSPPAALPQPADMARFQAPTYTMPAGNTATRTTQTLGARAESPDHPHSGCRLHQGRRHWGAMSAGRQVDRALTSSRHLPSLQQRTRCRYLQPRSRAPLRAVEAAPGSASQSQILPSRHRRESSCTWQGALSRKGMTVRKATAADTQDHIPRVVGQGQA